MRRLLLSLLAVFMVTLTVRSEATIVLSEGFENGIPATWTQDTVTPNASLVYGWLTEPASTATNPTGVAEGTTRVYMRNTTSRTKACVTRLITPVMDCAIYQPRLIFAHAQAAKSSGAYDQLKIYYRSTPTAEWTLMTEFTERIDGWRYDTLDLIGPTNTYQLAFEGNCASGYGIVIDDITIKATSQCTDIQGLGVVPMSYSAELTIGDLSAESFQVVVTTAPVTDWTSFDPSTAVYYNPNYPDVVLTITGLQPQTDYYAYVRSYCSDNDTGFTNWVSATFRTSIGFPFAEDFDSIGSTLPDGWERMTGKLDEVYAGAKPTSYNGGWTVNANTSVTGSPHISSGTSTSNTYWLMMPAIDLTTVSPDSMIDLKFRMALTTTSTGTSNVITKTGLSFYVAISEDAGETWAAANTTTWSAAASADYDINSVTATPARYRVNLNAYKGKVIRVAFISAATSGSGYFHVDDVVMNTYDAQCGDASHLKLTASSNSVTATWVIYGKENATIQIATDNAFTNMVDSAVITTGMTYTFTNLSPATTYYVRVKQDCEDAGWAMASCRTAVGIPYLNPFVSTTFPSDWTRYNGVSLQDVLSGTVSLVTPVTSGWSMGSNSTNFPGMGYRAYTNIYSTYRNWMVSPLISMEENSNEPLRLSFMAALTEGSSSSAAVAPEFEANDNNDAFAVLISLDGGLTWLPADAHIWDTDSTSTNAKLWEFNQVPRKVSIDLTAYRGQLIRIAIYGGSVMAGSDNYMHIGNLTINTFDANCGGVSGLTCTTSPTSVTATWNTTGYPEVNVQLSKSITFATLVDSAVVTNGTIQFTNLQTMTQYYLRVRQQCSTDDSDWQTYAFKTPVGIPFSDPLTSGDNWTKMSGKVVDVLAGTSQPTTTTSGWSFSSSQSIDGITGTHAYYNLYSTSYNYWLVSLPINMSVENGDPIQLAFDLGFKSYYSDNTTKVENQMFWVVASTDNGTTWEKVYLVSAADSADYNINNCVDHAAHIKVPMTQYTGQTILLGLAGNQYVAGGDNYIHLANVEIYTIDANCQGLSRLEATNVTTNSASIEWYAGGQQSLDLIVATDTAFANIIFNESVTGTAQLTNLTDNTRYYMKARQTCDTEGEWTYTMFKTLCDAITPEGLGLVDFTEVNQIDCWQTGFITKGSTSTYALADVAYLERFGNFLALTKQGVNSESTQYNDGAYAIMPTLNIGQDTITKYQVSFDAATFTSYATNVGRLQVGIVTSPDALDTYEVLKTINLPYATDSTELSTFVVSFADYAGDYNEEYGSYIMFKSEAGADSMNFVLIDNIRVTIADNCRQLVDLGIRSVRTDSALFTWEDASASSYEVMVSPYGGRADTIQASSCVFTATTSADSVYITGLTAYTRYFAYVRGVCVDGATTSYSAWSSGKSFRTECEAIRTYPWMETFESMEEGAFETPACWDLFQYAAGTGSGTSGQLFQIATLTSGGNGTKLLKLPDMPKGEKTQLTLPVMYFVPGVEYQFSISVYRNGTGSTMEGLRIYASETGSVKDAVEMGFISRHIGIADSAARIPAEESTGWYRYDLNIPLSGYAHIIIMGESQYGSATYADNLEVHLAPTCKRPTITTASATTSTITLSWVDGNAPAYLVQRSADAEFTVITDSLIVNNTTTATLTNVPSYSSWYVRVQGICSAEDRSEFSKGVLVNTGAAIPFSETFNHSALPSSWKRYTGDADSAYVNIQPVENTSSQTYHWNAYTSSYGLDANHLIAYIYHSSSYNYDYRWLISPTIDMTASASDSIVCRFNMAYTQLSSESEVSSTVASQMEFRLMVSTDDGLTWTRANSWIWRNNDSTAYATPASIPVNGRDSKYSFDFSRFIGQQIRVAFYYTTTSTTSSRLHIGNFEIIKLVSGCAEPTDVVLSDTTSNSVTLSWQGDSTRTTIIQTAFDNAFTSNVRFDTVPSGLSYVLNNLADSKVYFVRMKQLCDNDNETPWTATYSFQTLCSVVMNYPWQETFDNELTGDIEIPCWNNEHLSGSGSYIFQVSAGIGTNSTKVCKLPDMSSGTMTLLTLPEMQIPEANAYEFMLDVYRNDSYSGESYQGEGLRILVSATGQLTDAVELGFIPRINSVANIAAGIPAESEVGWYNYSFTLPVSGNCYILIKGESKYGAATYSDNYLVRAMPTCQDIRLIDVTNITTSSAQVIVNEHTATTFEYMLTDAAIDVNDMDSIAQSHVVYTVIGGDTMLLTNLEDATIYNVYVRAICSETDLSNWSSAVRFTTECMPIDSLPWNDGFETYAGGTYSTKMDGPICWNTYSTGSYKPHVVSSGSSYYYTHSGTKSLCFYGTGDSYAAMPNFATPFNEMHMSFWMRTSSISSGTLSVGYITADDNDFDTFTEIATLANCTTMTKRTVDLGDVPVTATRLVFRWHATSSYACCIDDVEMVGRSSDETILNVKATNVTRSSMDITWTPRPDSTICANYELVISKTALNNAALDTVPRLVITDETSYHATLLARSTNYYIYVRTVCDSLNGAWVSTSAKTMQSGADCTSSMEQTVVTGSSQIQYVPWSDFYNSTYSQQIYTAAELTAAGISAGYISSVAFQYCHTSSYTKTVTIYMGTTANTEFSSTSYLPVTAVSDPVTVDFTTDGTWYTFPLSTPYYWDGVSNLVVGMMAMGTDYPSSGTPTFYGGQTSQYRAVYSRSDSDIPSTTSGSSRTYNRANIRMMVCPPLVPCPEITGIEAELQGDGMSEAIIHWNASNADYANGYDLFYTDNDSIMPDSVNVPQYVNLTDTFVDLTNLEAYTLYHVYVRVHCNAGGNDDGDSEWTKLSFMTLSSCPVITNLNAYLTSKTSAEATWNLAFAEQAMDFRYILSTTEMTDAELAVAVPASDITGHLYFDNLTIGQQYWLYVAAVCGEEFSPYVSTTFITPDNCAVNNLTVTSVAHNAVSLSWGRSLFGEEASWEVGIVGDSTNVTIVNDSVAILFGLRAETQYTAYVKALCDGGETSSIYTVAFTTAAPLPSCFTVGEGTNSISAPINGLYGYERNAYIFTPADGLDLGTLTSISWNYVTSTTATTIPAKIYLKNTTETTLSTSQSWNELIADAELVYDDVANIEPGWITFMISPFQYTGDNLMILVASEATGSGGKGRSAYYTSNSGNTACHMYGRKDSSIDDNQPISSCTSNGVNDQRHNTQFCFESPECAKPAGMTVSDVTVNSARLTWMPGGSERSWNTYLSNVQLASEVLDTLDYETLTVATRQYTGLTDDTDYWFYIRSICDSTSVGPWVCVHFITAASCEAPIHVNADSITSTSALIKWTNVNGGSPINYEVAYGPAAAFDVDDTTTYQVVIANDTVIRLSDLSSTTLYSVAVRVTCNATRTSRWSEPAQFRTDCGIVTAFPWSEDFDAYPAGDLNIPCWSWTQYQAGTGSGGSSNLGFQIYVGTQGSNSTHMLQLRDMKAGEKTKLDLPEMNIPQANEYEFVLDVYRSASGTSHTSEGLRIYVSPDGSMTNATEIGYISRNYTVADDAHGISAEDGTGWYTYELNIPISGVCRIIVMGESNYGLSTYSDNYLVRRQPLCKRPVFTNVESGTDYINLTWSGSDTITYVLERAANANFTGTIDSLIVNDTTASITGLSQNSTYYFRVRGFCGEDGESALSSVVRASTATGIPYSPDYDSMTAIPGDWYRSNTTAEAAFGGTPLADYSGGWNFASADVVMTNPHFKLNIWGTGCHYWLLTPILNIDSTTVADVMLSFDLSLCDYAHPGDPADSVGTDDMFMVVISEDGGATWNPSNATIWQNTPDADYRYSGIPSDHAESYHLDLSAYVGKSIQIGFYGESTVSGGDNDMHLANVRIAETLITRYTDTICDGTSYTENGFMIAPEEYVVGDNHYGIFTPGTAATPDQYASLDLTVRPIERRTITDTICEGAAYYIDENVYLEEGEVVVGEQTIIFTLTSANGCDSIIYLNVTGLPAARATESASTCSGIPYNWHGQDYYLGGTYVDTLQTVLGCDSICTLLLTVEDVIHTDTAITLCYGEQIIINGQTITTSGIYTETIDNPDGCDEEIVWHVTAIGKLESHKRVVACKGTTYSDDLIQGLTQEYHGSTTTTSKVSGCDSTVIYDIWFAEAGETIYVNVPENELPFYVNGLEIVAAGTPQGEYTRTIATSCGDVIMVVNVGEPIIRYTVTVKAENGLPYGSGVYVAGEQVEIGVNPFNGYKFEKWNDGNTDNPRTITVNADVTYTGSCVEEKVGLEDVLRDMDEDDVLKLIENQQLIIIRNGVRYNAQGAVIE